LAAAAEPLWSQCQKTEPQSAGARPFAPPHMWKPSVVTSPRRQPAPLLEWQPDRRTVPPNCLMGPRHSMLSEDPRKLGRRRIGRDCSHDQLGALGSPVRRKRRHELERLGSGLKIRHDRRRRASCRNRCRHLPTRPMDRNCVVRYPRVGGSAGCDAWDSGNR